MQKLFACKSGTYGLWISNPTQFNSLFT